MTHLEQARESIRRAQAARKTVEATTEKGRLDDAFDSCMRTVKALGLKPHGEVPPEEKEPK